MTRAPVVRSGLSFAASYVIVRGVKRFVENHVPEEWLSIKDQKEIEATEALRKVAEVIQAQLPPIAELELDDRNSTGLKNVYHIFMRKMLALRQYEIEIYVFIIFALIMIPAIVSFWYGTRSNRKHLDRDSDDKGSKSYNVQDMSEKELNSTPPSSKRKTKKNKRKEKKNSNKKTKRADDSTNENSPSGNKNTVRSNPSDDNGKNRLFREPHNLLLNDDASNASDFLDHINAVSNSSGNKSDNVLGDEDTDENTHEINDNELDNLAKSYIIDRVREKEGSIPREFPKLELSSPLNDGLSNRPLRSSSQTSAGTNSLDRARHSRTPSFIQFSPTKQSTQSVQVDKNNAYSQPFSF
ncbi:hypothetical protein KAFR_0B06880 [Kazachstania africana CBS 2517]|uniref:Uncharacterized protein n=1 Tax=Kazachstania africana (strain ATCC 22294 / BCRC 22015 / CBS 2517 / CECT 1963 / NBRC 1671 / NRRL Y-8276) TaxID=1071382 RepID=H2ARI5_KAZAF|nr:hypothetical protein KAFR_0B06880 [Kazachstania africana CBS 2517]CCF56985.1 hypothetical protein KAFR_0B06880 [Kazachstania africana CBS 2517]